MATSSAMSTSNQYVKYTITVTENSTDVSNNSSNVTVSVRFYRTNTGYTTYGTGTVYCKINGVTYSAAVTSSQKITNSGIVLFTKSLNVSHNSDGTKTLACSAWITHSVLTSSEQSYNQALTTLARKSTVSASDGTLGTTMKLTVNRNNSSFTHTITYESGSYSGTICTKSSSTSINWTPPLTLATGAPNGDKVYVAFTIETFSGSTSLGTSRTPIWCTIPATVKPTVSFTASDAMGYSSSFGGYVQGASKVQVAVTASGAQGSTIKTYKTTLDGREYNASSFTSELLSGTGTLTINVTVTDSRGRTATASQDITVFEYFPPKITKFVVKRCNADGTSNSSGDYIGILFDAAVAPVNNQNRIYFGGQYKKVSDSSYTNAFAVGLPTNQYSTTNKLVVLEADASSSYDLYLEAEDSILSLRKYATAPPASKLFSILQKGLGWAFGKVAEIENALDVAWDTYIRKNLYVTGSVKASSGVYDGFDTMIRNGAAAYTGSGTGNAIDPNTTTEHLILTDVNVPMSGFCYIMTFFYSTKSDSSNRAQFAIPYSTDNYVYHRYYYNGSWSDWENNESISDSGWQTLASSGTAFIKYRKKSGFVTVAGTSFGSYSVSAKSYYTFSTALPSEFRPAINVITAGVSRSNTGYELQAEVSSAGVVRVYNSNPNAAINYWGFNITYPV